MRKYKATELIDPLLAPIAFVCAGILGFARGLGVQNLPLSKRAMIKAGTFPILNHYYEPLFDSTKLRHALSDERNLPGVDWNVQGQLELLDRLVFGDELIGLPKSKTDQLEYYLNNDMFGPGDAEYFYNMIRLLKPSRILEVGSGHSTLMGLSAIRRNTLEDPTYTCDYICIEPYEAPWLEQTGATIIRQTVETVPMSNFDELQSGDVLFIDSSHVVRPQGDVVFEYLELIPSLRTGVIVHIHDIFSPRDYPKSWVEDDVKFWNEQYLLEAFLTCNMDWQIIGALNYLQHNYSEQLHAACPNLAVDAEPGSFYIQKVR